MAGNTFGDIFRLTTFGESHGPAIGGVIDGCPAGLTLDLDLIRTELLRRRPGQSALTTARNETDDFEILSGTYQGKTTGAPIAFLIRNKDARPSDYEKMKSTYRPSHADYVYDVKYGIRDPRGGGRASARETAARVFGGAIARQLLPGISITAYVSQVGTVRLEKEFSQLELGLTESNPVRCPDEKTADAMIAAIESARSDGDTLGGMVTCVLSGVPAGLGEPVFDKLHADLGKAMLSINAVHGFEYGSGFKSVSMKGSQHNDILLPQEGKQPRTKTNHAGGILGGISNGMDIYFNVAFKPVSTLMKPQQSIDTKGVEVTLNPGGRHDPCVVPRAVPIVEAMAALVLADHTLRNKNSKISVFE